MKRLFLILGLLIGLTSYSQERISLGLYHDAKYMSEGKLNMLIRFNMQGNQQTYGYMTISPEFEYAELEGEYFRYAVNIGYTFNELVLKNSEAGFALGGGFIDRYRKALFSLGGNFFIKYKINDHIKVSILAQAVDRKDLKWLWGKDIIRFSGFIGLEVN